MLGDDFNDPLFCFLHPVLLFSWGAWFSRKRNCPAISWRGAVGCMRERSRYSDWSFSFFRTNHGNLFKSFRFTRQAFISRFSLFVGYLICITKPYFTVFLNKVAIVEFQP